MKSKTKIIYSIIIPTFNEVDNIAPLIKSIYKTVKNPESLEVIVSDDDSPDKTWMVVKKLAKLYPTLTLIRRKKNHGLVRSIQEGIDKAQGKYVGWMDADFSHPPTLLPKLMSRLENSNAVIASRYAVNAKDSRKERTAVLFSNFLNKLARLLISNKASDYTSGYILLEKSIFKKYKLVGDYGEYFIDLVTHLLINKHRVSEVDYISTSRTKGNSKTATSVWGLLKRGPSYFIILFKKAAQFNLNERNSTSKK